MKKHLLFGIALLTLDGASAAPGPGGNDPRDSIRLLNPPAADPLPEEINPFVGTQFITLTVPNRATVYYDIDNPEAFDPAGKEAHEYIPGKPIEITRTATLRAASVSQFGPLVGQSEVMIWHYNLDVKPSLTVLNPTNGQVFHPGETVTIASNVNDPDGPEPITVTYYRAVSGGGWTALPAPGNGADHKLDVFIPEATPPATHIFRAIATDGRSLADTVDVAVTIALATVAPVITNASATGSGTVGVNATLYTVTATGNPRPTFDASGLPPGLAINANTGAISGTPTTAGPFTTTVTASNGVNPAASKVLTLTISAAPMAPTITNTLVTASGTVGVNATLYTVTATGNPTPTFRATGLPPGLTINAGTGAISGAPTVADTYNATVTAFNGVSPEASKVVTFTISAAPAAPVITNASATGSGTVGVNATLYTVTATGNPRPT
ncbi:MAG TPA: putative Ig domain-containing protein, partial [Fibrobacteria bacterium]|nr:putative Ig domain-containing protein [Fibrobacteria bacterium]